MDRDAAEEVAVVAIDYAFVGKDGELVDGDDEDMAEAIKEVRDYEGSADQVLWGGSGSMEGGGRGLQSQEGVGDPR